MKTLKNYFDKICVINYIEAPDRRENMIKQLKHYNFEDGVEFSYGMPFAKINAIAPHFEEISNTTGIYSNIGTIGCAFQHYTAIKTAYELGVDSILILEDDIIFRDDRDLIIDYLDNIPKDWEYLYFTPMFSLHNPNINNDIIHDETIILNAENKWIDMKKLNHGQTHIVIGTTPLNGYFSSGAYALKRTGMKLYISLFENSKTIMNSDMLEFFFHNISQSPLKSYIPKTGLFAVNNGIGTLLKTGKNTFNLCINGSNGAVVHSSDITKENFNFNSLIEKNSIIWDN